MGGTQINIRWRRISCTTWGARVGLEVEREVLILDSSSIDVIHSIMLASGSSMATWIFPTTCWEEEMNKKETSFRSSKVLWLIFSI